MRSPEGWRSRGYLPHIDAEGLTQFLTWRTADSLPNHVVDEWKAQLQDATDDDRRRELLSRTAAYCDAGHGECPMADPRAARALQETLFRDHAEKYRLIAWAIMPNHVHTVLTPLTGVSLAKIVMRLKSTSAHMVNAAIGRTGTLWQPDYFDRYIRDSEHMERIVHYIEWNPVKAGLCTDPKHWHWSSANVDAVDRLRQLEAGKAG